MARRYKRDARGRFAGGSGGSRRINGRKVRRAALIGAAGGATVIAGVIVARKLGPGALTSHREARIAAGQGFALARQAGIDRRTAGKWAAKSYASYAKAGVRQQRMRARARRRVG